MAKHKRLYYILGALFLLLIVLQVCKRNLHCADVYHLQIYPYIVRGINRFSALFPFSIYDVFIVVAVVFLVWQIVRFFKGQRQSALLILLITCTSIFVAFEMSWGINYFSSDFFQRNALVPHRPDSAGYAVFVNNYVEEMNQAYAQMEVGADSVSPEKIIAQYNYASDALHYRAIEGYKQLSKQYVIDSLPSTARAKQMLFGRTYAGMGILGYYGPFFAEAHLNPELLAHQVPFTYLHEMAHLVGITSEAEANFYAFMILATDSVPALRFCAYQSLLPHVLGNARRLMSREDYKHVITKVQPQILALILYTNKYWDDMYSPTIGSVQNYLYDYYLKGNNIPSGLTNYSEVVQLLVSTRK
ncbi:MAG: DUF3810 domain-containing protein [Marinifilaceae bacterium]